jgi:hypothetical protein
MTYQPVRHCMSNTVKESKKKTVFFISKIFMVLIKLSRKMNAGEQEKKKRIKSTEKQEINPLHIL